MVALGENINVTSIKYLGTTRNDSFNQVSRHHIPKGRMLPISSTIDSNNAPESDKKSMVCSGQKTTLHKIQKMTTDARLA
jgi:hypothetical protein